MFRKIVCIVLLLWSKVCFAVNTDITWMAPYLLPSGHSDTPVREWTSYNGYIFGFNDVIVVRLRFDDESVNVFNSKPGFGLDIDIIQCTSGEPIAESTIIQHTFPNNVNAIRDTTFDDSMTSSGSCKADPGNPYVIGTLLLRDVENVTAERDYYVYFHLASNLPLEGARLHLSLQLSYDVQIVDNPLHEIILDHFGQNALDSFDYFLVEGDGYTSFDAYPSGNHGTCWGSKTQSSNCSVIQNQCFASMEKSIKKDILDFFFPVVYAANCSGGITAYSESVRVGILPEPSTGSPDLPPEILNPGTTGGGGMNDMKIEDVTMSKGANSTRESTLYQDPGEKFYAYAKLDNDGSATAYDFKIKFYIDGGERNFNKDDEDYQDSIRIDSYQPGAEIRYAKELTAPTESGIYWVYACVTSLDNDGDEDNNCSDEDSREEYGKLVIGDPSIENGGSAGTTGKSWNELTQGEKAAILQIILN